MSPPTPAPAVNRLLAALPHQDHVRFLAGCETVQLQFSDVLAEPGDTIDYAYFPLDSFISILAPTAPLAGLEVGLIGNEGMLGISLILGVGVSPLHALVQGGGATLRMAAKPFRQELEQSSALLPILKRYLHVVIGQLAQTAACTHFHVLESRLARWLLMTQDRSHSDEFHVTQQFLAYMLGVRRVGITKAATSLQNRNLISYSRGDITILDRVGLEAASCVCYAADNATYNQVMT